MEAHFFIAEMLYKMICFNLLFFLWGRVVKGSHQTFIQ